MDKGFVIILICILFSTFGYAQTAKEGDVYFETFEFASAANSYAQARSANRLSKDQLEKLAYCYYITSKPNQGLSLVDSLINLNFDNKDLWLWKAQFEKELNLFDEAINSSDRYIQLGGTELPLMFQESLRLWMDSPVMQNGALSIGQFNDLKANFVSNTCGVPVYFFETGLDSLGKQIGIAGNNPQAEVFLMRPFVIENGIPKEWLITDKEFNDYAINSIQYDQKEKRVYFSATKPISEQTNEFTSKIYTGKSDGIGSPITEVEKLDLVSLDENSYSAHLALSSSGDQMIFMNQGKNTRRADLWVTRKIDENWTAPTELVSTNTVGNEMFPVISGDTALLFSSDGRIGYGGLDIFMVYLQPDWNLSEEIVLMPLPINSMHDDFSYQIVSSELAYFTSNRPGGKGDDDVWSFTKEKIVIEIPLIESIPEPELVIVENLPDPFDIVAFLKESNAKRTYFDFNSAVPNNNLDFVEKLGELIESGNKFEITISGYSDSRGSKSANDAMGMNRALAVQKNLISRGIPEKLILVKSYGSTKIENRCKTGVECSEEEHKGNRNAQINIVWIK